MLDKQLLEILVCPKCKGELNYQIHPENDRDGELICQVCKLAYKVEDDIPIMLVDEANPLNE
jgi:uncharacterized protein YbaR (Trm112 family)